MVEVVEREFGELDQQALGGVAGRDDGAFLAAFHEQFVGIHLQAALALAFLVALEAAPFEDGGNHVGIDQLVGQSFGGGSGGFRG